MLARVLAVVLTDVLLYILLRLLLNSPFTEGRGRLPLSMATLVCIMALFAHAGVSQAAVAYAALNHELLFAIVCAVLGAVFLLSAFLPMLTNSLASTTVDAAFGGMNANNQPMRLASDLSRARLFADNNDIDAAVREYRRYFNSEPGNAEPLLQAAHLLRQAKRHDEALEMFREALPLAWHNTAAWSGAAFHLADLLLRQYSDIQGARHLLREIVHRVPDSPLGRHVSLRLLQPPFTPASADQPSGGAAPAVPGVYPGL